MTHWMQQIRVPLSSGAIRLSVVILSIVIYLVSLFLPAFVVRFPDIAGDPLGWECLLFGWGNLFELQPAWLANPLLFIALFLIAKRRTDVSVILLAVAIVAAFFSLRVDEVLRPARMRTVEAMGTGFYVWLTSLIVPAAYALLIGGVDRHQRLQQGESELAKGRSPSAKSG